MTAPAASARGISKHFGATRALDDVDFDVAAGRDPRAGRRERRRQVDADPHPRRRASAGPRRRSRSTASRATSRARTTPSRPASSPSRRNCGWCRRCRSPRTSRSAICRCGVCSASAGASIARACARRRAHSSRSSISRPIPIGRVDRLSFAERQLVAIAKALRRRCRALHPRRADRRAGDPRDRAPVRRARAHEGAGHRDHLCLAPARRGGGARRPLHGAARRPRRGAAPARRVQRRRSGAGHDRPRRRRAWSPSRVAPGRDAARGRRPIADAIRVRAGEVVGLAGLLGSGTDRVLRRLFGVATSARATSASTASRTGSPTRPTPSRAGIGMVPGERRLGLVMNLSVRDNILLPSLDRLSRGGLDRPRGRRSPGRRADGAARHPPAPAASCGPRALSGGNQQKVILAKWLARRVGVLLLDEPTQGVDVAAKAQIHALIREFAQRRRRRAGQLERPRRAGAHLRRRAGGASGPDRGAHRARGRLRREAAARGDRRLTMRAHRLVERLAGQIAADHADRAVRRHGAADRPLPVAAQPHQHPGAVLDHGGDRHRHDLRDHRRRLRSLGRLDRGARRAASPPW